MSEIPLYTSLPAPYTLHPTPYALHPEPFIHSFTQIH